MAIEYKFSQIFISTSTSMIHSIQFHTIHPMIAEQFYIHPEIVLDQNGNIIISSRATVMMVFV